MRKETMYSTFDTCKILDIKLPTLQGWIKSGIAVPSVRATGLGTKNLFSEKDIVRILFAMRLMKTRRGKILRTILDMADFDKDNFLFYYDRNHNPHKTETKEWTAIEGYNLKPFKEECKRRIDNLELEKQQPPETCPTCGQKIRS